MTAFFTAFFKSEASTFGNVIAASKKAAANEKYDELEALVKKASKLAKKIEKTEKKKAKPARVDFFSIFEKPGKSEVSTPAAITASASAPAALLSGEELARRFMAKLLDQEFMTMIAEQQLSEEEVAKAIAARGEATIVSLKDQAEPAAYAEFYAAYRKQHPAPQEPEMVVAEAAIIETSVDNGEPKVLSELVNQTVEASGSQTAMAEKLSRAAELVKEGKRKNRQQHRRAA